MIKQEINPAGALYRIFYAGDMEGNSFRVEGLAVERKLLKILSIGAGGFVGAILRYLISSLVYRLPGTATFPYGTLTVNMAGCFLIGLGGGLVEHRQLFPTGARSFIFIGLLGSFTTFSTFGFESFNLTRDGQITATALNIIVHIIFGLVMVWMGNVISRIV